MIVPAQPGAPPTDAPTDAATVTPPDLDFAVLGARPVRHAASPTLTLDLEISEAAGRPVYMVALTIQLMIEPARRSYDADTHGGLVELFGDPQRWAVTTRSLVWARLDVLVPAFTGTTVIPVPVTCHYDLELAAAKYLYALPDGEAPLALHFTGMIYYPAPGGGLQMVLLPWTKSIGYRLPVSVWRETVEHYYPGTGWVALRTATLDRLRAEKLSRGLATIDACVEALLEESGGP